MIWAYRVDSLFSFAASFWFHKINCRQSVNFGNNSRSLVYFCETKKRPSTWKINTVFLKDRILQVKYQANFQSKWGLNFSHFGDILTSFNLLLSSQVTLYIHYNTLKTYLPVKRKVNKFLVLPGHHNGYGWRANRSRVFEWCRMIDAKCENMIRWPPWPQTYNLIPSFFR